MPTQSMSPSDIRQTYGIIDRLIDAAACQPIAPNLPAGTITDDTEQALLLAGLLVAGGGRIDPGRFADALAAWQQRMVAQGSLDLLGPSTLAAVAAIQAGAGPDDDPGASGATDGAAMRIAPVGIAVGPDGPDDAEHRVDGEVKHSWTGLVEAVVAASRLTHNTNLGLSSAAAVAAAVSAGLAQPVRPWVDPMVLSAERSRSGRSTNPGPRGDPGGLPETDLDSGPKVTVSVEGAVNQSSEEPSGICPAPDWATARVRLVEAARSAASLAAGQGHWLPGGDIAARIDLACQLVDGWPVDQALRRIDQLIGTSVAAEQAIPAAFAIIWRFGDQPFAALCAAAQVGGDTDTIGAMAGAMLGAWWGMAAWPAAVVEQVMTVNQLEIDAVVDSLLTLRQTTQS
jgi:ADP-ribosylglycohydrolase